MLKRILLTTDTVGGVWCYSMELARSLAERGTEVVLAVLGPIPGSAQRLEAASIPGMRLVATGLELDWLAKSPDEIEFAANVIAAIARQIDADTVQLHAPALVGRAVWPVPVLAVAHSCVGTWWQATRGGALPFDMAWRAEATELGINRADVVIVPSRSFAAELRLCYDVARPIEVVLNGRTPLLSHATRRSQVLTSGRLWDEGKNVAALDAAAEQLTWPVLAAGSLIGPNGTSVTCRHLRMLGVLDAAEMADEYAKAMVFVSLAHYEPFGLAVLEAAQAGCAMVLSDIPTFRELWDGAAVFVSDDSPDRVAGVLDRLLRNPDVSAQYGAQAFQTAASFNVRRMTDAIWAIHERVATQTRSAA